MSSTYTRNANRIVPITSAILAGAAPARRRLVHRVPADHPRRRADDVEQGPTVTPIASKTRAQTEKRDVKLMNDWPEDNKPVGAKRPAVSLWDSKPCLLAAFWGWLPRE